MPVDEGKAFPPRMGGCTSLSFRMNLGLPSSLSVSSCASVWLGCSDPRVASPQDHHSLAHLLLF